MQILNKTFTSKIIIRGVFVENGLPIEYFLLDFISIQFFLFGEEWLNWYIWGLL